MNIYTEPDYDTKVRTVCKYLNMPYEEYKDPDDKKLRPMIESYYKHMVNTEKV